MIFFLEVKGELTKCLIDDPRDESMLLIAMGMVASSTETPEIQAAAVRIQRGIARLIVEAGKFTVQDELR